MVGEIGPPRDWEVETNVVRQDLSNKHTRKQVTWPSEDLASTIQSSRCASGAEGRPWRVSMQFWPE